MRRIVWSLLLWACAVPAQATLWRVVTNDFPPYVGADLPQQGFYAALIRRVLAEQSLQMELHYQPPARVRVSILEGQFDAAFPLLRTTERERDLVFSDPLLSVRSYLFVRADSTITGLADLPGKRSCHLQGSNQPVPVQRMVDDGIVKIERVAHTPQCFEMLARGRVDFVALSDYAGWAGARQSTAGLSAFKTVGGPIAYGYLHLVWPRQDPRAQARAADFNRVLADLRRRGVVKELEQTLLPSLPEDPDQPPTKPVKAPAERGR
ncbi:substrate-binding periplasmic protein [Inhella gelatinilytica]|uniref:Transporter substrate-binding domain-containing protein n=1 Tax=Inhella gelatinilytica TaxID=2795030 RepID=A0A931IV65_9BURK|nr:transporter substrate-binding domain-containing protein [Inhella gelatinilytica]MBH9552146.1 transporter substrate-binding domain-containing protein [Inhella gelatinilytica]